MTPQFCRVRHEPENGLFGDCVRACVGTILDTNEVPHFFYDGTTGGFLRMRQWLETIDRAPVTIAYDAATPLSDIFAFQEEHNPWALYMLFHRTTSGIDHCVVCRGGEVVHDPSWVNSKIAGAQGSHWLLIVIGVA